MRTRNTITNHIFILDFCQMNHTFIIFLFYQDEGCQYVANCKKLYKKFILRYVKRLPEKSRKALNLLDIHTISK